MSTFEDQTNKDVPQQGFSVLSDEGDVLRPGWFKSGRGYKNRKPSSSDYLKNLNEERLALFGVNDDYVAIASKAKIIVLGFKNIGRGPIAKISSKTVITHIIATGTTNPLEIIVADIKGDIWSYDFNARFSKDSSSISITKPSVKLVVGGIKEPIRRLIGSQKKIFVQTQSAKVEGFRLHELDRRSKQLQFRGEIILDTPISLLHPQNDNLLIGFEKGELRIIQVNEISLSPSLKAKSLELPRVSSIALLNNRYLLVAQKGGHITKVDVHRVTRDPDVPGAQQPDDSAPKPSNDLIKDEPCEGRHKAKLQWTVERLAVKNNYVLAFSAGNRRMALMDDKLNLLFERYLGDSNISVDVGQTKTQNLLILQTKHERLEAWSLVDYAATLAGLLPNKSSFIPPAPTSSAIFYGSPHQRASPNPQLKVCVFTVIEPGQNFTDPNQGKFVTQIRSNVLDIVNDYYHENSYDELDVQFSIFGADFGGTRVPLILPQALANYFWDDFTPGGVKAIMPANWTNPLVLDGTETLQLHTYPRLGVGRDYQIPFAGLWISKTHTSYPLQVNFGGTETLQLTVESQDGSSHVLNLTFGVLSLTLNQGDDETAFLTALGTNVTNAIRNAENALTGNPLTIQDVVFRRIRLNDDDTEFGQLQGQFKIAPSSPANFVQKGRITVTAVPTPLPAALDKLGFEPSGRKYGVLNSGSNTNNYFKECLSAAQFDAGEGPGSNEPHFNKTVVSSEDTVAQQLTVTIQLTNNKGGTGARIEVTGHTGHGASGWSVAVPVFGSQSDYNNRNTLRHSGQLINDVFTAALDHIRTQGPWNSTSARNMFQDFDVMMIGFVGQAPASVPAPDRWNVDNPVDFARLRMFARNHHATDLHNPNPSETPVTMNTSVIVGQKFDTFQPGLMSHELGHAMGLPDLYQASGFRDDVLYIDEWEMMGGVMDDFNHFCGWSKWALGWIVENHDPAHENINRVVDVPMPSPTGTTVTESWLVPVEHWDSSIKTDVRNVVGGSIPIAQLMKVHLGSDGGVISFLELRSRGSTYSQLLPGTQAVIATNVLDPNSDRRWAVNGLYRRAVHRLNEGTELTASGDSWDFASSQEFPVKGCTVHVVDVQHIRAGTIPIFRLRVEREQAEYIDIHFQDPVPSYRSPDIWVDWPDDNPDPNVPRIYPEGTPFDQGETIRFPSSGIENHYLVSRVHNAGTVRAEDVKVRWFICDPPGSGDDGRWIERDTRTIAQIGPNDAEITAFNWGVDSSTNVHQCLRAEIIDWTIPSEVDPATGDTVALASDDVRLQNNNAQKNVFNFEALQGSPYSNIEFQFQVQNDYLDTEIAYLIPEGLPWGSKLVISPAEAHIKPGTRQIFYCTLSLDETIIQPGCNNDSSFLLTTWRRAHDADEKWGSCFYFIRPRYKTELEILRGYWMEQRMSVYGTLKLSTTEDVDISSEQPLYIRLRLEIQKAPDNNIVRWRIVPVDNNGQFNVDIHGDIASEQALSFVAQAWFDRTDLLGSSITNAREFKRQ